LGMLALRFIPLSLASVLESAGYVYVALLSYFVFKEKITKRKLFGVILIILGSILFVL